MIYKSACEIGVMAQQYIWETRRNPDANNFLFFQDKRFLGVAVSKLCVRVCVRFLVCCVGSLAEL
jgi:hypothetical protein